MGHSWVKGDHMQITEIRRIVPRAEPAVVAPEPTILERAQEVLGYKPYVQLIETSKATALRAKLADLEIEVLNRDDVLRYQAEHAAEEMLGEKFHALLIQDRWGQPWEYLTIWKREAIENYSEPIPEFVLNKAVQIKQRVPEVKIFIEHLEFGLDPFLVVTTGERWKDQETEYIEVWAEPKFEGRGR
jgi:hypothetical protein